MQLTAEVRRLFAKNPASVNAGQMKIKFTKGVEGAAKPARDYSHLPKSERPPRPMTKKTISEAHRSIALASITPRRTERGDDRDGGAGVPALG